MRKAKFVKPLLIGCACCIPVGLVVGLSVNWDHRQFISAVGSSGVKPFVEAFAKDFATTNPKIDVQIESGGTTFAIEEVAKGLANIGNASNNPYYSIQKNSYQEQWVNKKTFTLGFEGLVIMYKMPDGLSEEAQDNFDIVITQDNILDLFSIFSGFNESLIGGKVYPWKDPQDAQWRGSMLRFMTDESIGHLKPEDREIILKTPITPFVRSGGNTAANSSIAFTYYSNLADMDDMTPNQQNAFGGGQYGKDRNHFETEESNARAWEMFSKVNLPGSMVYLTTGFVTNKNNQEEIKKYGYRLAGYLPKPTEKTPQPTPVHFEKEGDLKKICIEGGYNWYRPINCMIDLDNELSKAFIEAIFTNNSYEKIMKDNGAKPLTNAQMISMAVDGDMFSKKASDIELVKTRSEEYCETYGAEDIWE